MFTKNALWFLSTSSVSSLCRLLFLAYEASEQKNKNMTFVYIGLAVLFQPFFKIALGREFWNLIDVFLAVILLASVFTKRNHK